MNGSNFVKCAYALLDEKVKSVMKCARKVEEMRGEISSWMRLETGRLVCR